LEKEVSMTNDAVEIRNILTDSQRQCISNLSEDWKEIGYSKVDADILYALGGSDLYGKYPPIVDCDFHRPKGMSPNYRHRLLPLGIEVQKVLL
jgi:hypothetical protein